MEIVLVLLTSALMLRGSLVQALHCNNTEPADDTYPREPCQDPEIANDENLNFSPFNDAAYLALIASASVLLPFIVFVRVCWLKKLQKQRASIVDQTRQQVLEEQRRAGTRSGIFMIDLDGIPFEEIYGKPPPTYEDSMSNQDCSNPPPYDKHPPSYISVFPGVSPQDNELPSSSNQDLETSEYTQQCP